jgi:predicted nuclease with TOPRIM domain
MEEAKGEELQAFKKRVQELEGELAEVHRKMRNRPEDYEQHLKREMAELKRRLEGSDEKLKLKK